MFYTCYFVKKKKCYLVFRVKETRGTSKGKKKYYTVLKIKFMEKGDEKSDFSEYEKKL